MAVVEFQRDRERWPVTRAFFGPHADREAARLVEELREDRAVVSVKLNGRALAPRQRR